MRRLSGQRGMTLIELLVAMAVMGILMAGLGDVLVNVSSRFDGWSQRIQSSTMAAGLASSLQSDSHRYAYCTPAPFGASTYELDFCTPQDIDSRAAVVRYEVSATAPYVITRSQPITGTPAFMARSETGARPNFWVDCFNDGNGTVSGHVHIYSLRLYNGLGQQNGPNFSVYYVAPWRPGCG